LRDTAQNRHNWLSSSLNTYPSEISAVFAATRAGVRIGSTFMERPTPRGWPEIFEMCND
jgi:hypothetical protein